ncbi:hypothetical protein THIOKS12710014 [Thiocapsa sp. KS1]|nr:hypothetical protein THIOKS12710014 [Thiocapsa sp. KS1]
MRNIAVREFPTEESRCSRVQAFFTITDLSAATSALDGGHANRIANSSRHQLSDSGGDLADEVAGGRVAGRYLRESPDQR